MRKYDVFDVCDYILSIESMTPKRLQKILYFCYSFYLAANNTIDKKITNRLFLNQFEAWIHGPVIPKVYAKYAKYGMLEVPCESDPCDNDVIDKEDSEFISFIVNSLKQYTTYQIEMITHNQSPWKNARGNCGIDEPCKSKLSDIDIMKCFSKMVKNG